jgi:hypothetical protein
VEFAGHPVLLELDCLLLVLTLLNERDDGLELTEARESEEPAELFRLAEETEPEDLLERAEALLLLELTAERALDDFLHCNGHCVFSSQHIQVPSGQQISVLVHSGFESSVQDNRLDAEPAEEG